MDATNYLKPVLVKRLRSRELIFKGFRYLRNSSKGNATYWRCENNDCPGRLTTDEERNVRNAHAHTHKPNPNQVEAKRVRTDARAVAELSKSSNEVHNYIYFRIYVNIILVYGVFYYRIYKFMIIINKSKTILF